MHGRNALCPKFVFLRDLHSGVFLAAAAALSPKPVPLHTAAALSPKSSFMVSLLAAALSPELVSLAAAALSPKLVPFNGFALGCRCRLVSQACLPSGFRSLAALCCLVSQACLPS